MRTIKKTQKQKNNSFKIWIHRIFSVFLTTVFIILVVLCLWSVYNGYAQEKWNMFINKFHTTLGNIGFELNNEALITGRKRTSEAQIIEALNIPQNKLITTLDLNRIQENLEKLPWIKQASVRRQLPNILHIYLNERKPIALWQKEQKHFPVDENGDIVNSMCDECVYLPIVVGKTIAVVDNAIDDWVGRPVTECAIRLGNHRVVHVEMATFNTNRVFADIHHLAIGEPHGSTIYCQDIVSAAAK